MKKLPSIRNLQYLIRLHEFQNFNKAAKACFVSQSTLSTGIQNLEEQLDCQLIERDNKSFIFTTIGENIVEQAKDIVQRVAELSEIAEHNTGAMTGQLVIGCIPTITPFLVQPLYQYFQQHYPNLQIQLKEDTTDNLLKQLDLGELDALILALPVDTGSFKTKLVGRDQFWLVAHEAFLADHDLAAQAKLASFEALPDESVYLLEKEHCLTQHAVSACQSVQGSKINPFSATSLQTLVEMVTCQLGVTFIPQIAINAGLIKSDSSLVVIEPTKLAYREIGLVWRGTTQRSQTFVQFAAGLATIFAE